MEPHTTKAWPKGLPKQLSVPKTSLYYNLEASAARYPDKRALVFYDSTLTFAQLKQQVDALAGFLRERCGVKRGDRVLLFMQNSPQFTIGFYAILRADAMVVPINPMNLTEELRHYVSDSDAKVVLCGQELYPQIQPLLGAGVGTRTWWQPTPTTSPARPISICQIGARTARIDGRRCGCNALGRCAGRGPEPGAAPGRPGGSVRDALHFWHNRPTEGMHPYPRYSHEHAGHHVGMGRFASGLHHPRHTADVSRHRHAGSDERTDLYRRLRRVDDALGS